MLLKTQGNLCHELCKPHHSQNPDSFNRTVPEPHPSTKFCSVNSTQRGEFRLVKCGEAQSGVGIDESIIRGRTGGQSQRRPVDEACEWDCCAACEVESCCSSH
ncbi:hypothetical protein KC19_1G334200 [Ceratodon purpureus]|uniref:Uncharacterized protein n=1 Tax=Ceratodon purpureus TaxID=3225 RepID=A0A8T0JFQ1_CERPU|nr:hypothetical protein KC19_1G334200 [Ceratodon purpureus]